MTQGTDRAGVDNDGVVDRIYEVALEPSSLDDFIEFWHDNQLTETLADGDGSLGFDQRFKTHLDRAQTILQRDGTSRTDYSDHLKHYDNLATFVDYLRGFYDVRVKRAGDLDRACLDAFDVVVLKTPTRPYTPIEVDALHAWVEDGGGLYLACVGWADGCHMVRKIEPGFQE